jgi:hypothetical protein
MAKEVFMTLQLAIANKMYRRTPAEPVTERVDEEFNFNIYNEDWASAEIQSNLPFYEKCRLGLCRPNNSKSLTSRNYVEGTIIDLISNTFTP